MMKEREFLKNLQLLRQDSEEVHLTFEVMNRLESEQRKRVLIISGILLPFVFFFSLLSLKLIVNTPLKVITDFIYSFLRVGNLSPITFTFIFLLIISFTISFFASFVIIGGVDHEVLLPS
jgi:hypothetical protein